MNYYNEIELSARRWLRELIKDGLIPDGYIDNRPIQEVKAHELREFVQCHFFAGIGGWSYALRLAGVPDDEPLWSGSCPCQPFSDSGDQMGFRDPRHLFPTWRRLIARGQPPVVFGEQVASKLGREWLARVRLEMASLGYATRGADLCSAGVAAPNLRQRLYWMADTASASGTEQRGESRGKSWGQPQASYASECAGLRCPMAYPDSSRREGCRGPAQQDCEQRAAIDIGGNCHIGPVAHADGGQCGYGDKQRCGEHGQQPQDGSLGVALGDTNRAGRQGRGLRLGENTGQLPPWSSGTVGIKCTDGKTRRVKPEIFPLAARLPGDLGLIRGAGNAINPWIAVEFIRSVFP